MLFFMFTPLRKGLSLGWFSCLGYLAVISRSSVGGWMGGDVTAVRVVFMRGGRAQKSGKH